MTPPAGVSGPGPPLLIVCALGVEALALRGARSAPGGAGARVLRTGMGPRAARSAVARALRTEPLPGGTTVIAAGFCAGLVPGMRPGDLVLAEETRETRETRRGGDPPPGGGPCAPVRCTGTEWLARALGPLGTVHTGPLAGTAHVVRGAERAGLRSSGAVAVDMESAATLGTAVRTSPRGAPHSAPDESPHDAPYGVPGRPVAAVRVVVDAPGHELIRIGTVRGGISAFRVLRGVLPVFLEWHRSLLLPRR